MKSTAHFRFKPFNRACIVFCLLSLSLLLSLNAQAQFVPVIQLDDLDGSNGTTVVGAIDGDQLGFAVSNVGDVNDDGIDDFAVGAPFTDANAEDAGSAYIFFGVPGGFPATLSPSSLDGTNGFSVLGLGSGDAVGFRISAAGDLNNDQIADLVVAGDDADLNNPPFTEGAYVIFGREGAFPEKIEEDDLDGTTGFSIASRTPPEQVSAVDAAGDFNNDGIDDLVIGTSPNSFPGFNMGAAYVIYGKSDPFPSVIGLGSIGANGVQIPGIAAGDRAGFAVSAAGDINNDGIDDIAIGAPFADINADGAGSVYVVFGVDGDLPSGFSLDSMDGSDGFTLNGLSMNDEAGSSLASAGDFNGDGLADLIIGVPFADSSTIDSGISYIVFGKDTPFAATETLVTYTSSALLTINGGGEFSFSGWAVSGAGDINGDGFDDVIIGAPFTATGPTSFPGAAYAVFGRAGNAPVELSELDGNDGFQMLGTAGDDRAGSAVGGAGDFNQDGLDDLLVGAYGVNMSPGVVNSGKAYVVYGQSLLDIAITKSNNASFADPTQPITYTIQVDNFSTEDVGDVLVTDVLPATLINATWNCTATGGAVCENPSGSGDISQTVDLPGRSQVSFLLSADINASEGEVVSNTATAFPVDMGVEDEIPGNNTSTDTDALGLFIDNFED